MKKTVAYTWILLISAAFTVDILTSLGYTVFFLYTGLLFLFMYSDKKHIVLAAITSCAFIIIGAFLSPNIDSAPFGMALTNRVMGVVLILFIMFGMIKFSRNRILLLKKINELEIANKDLESFNFISSHDLQEPLRKIHNYVNMLQKEKIVSEEGQRYLRELGETSVHARALIEDLLKYSRITKINHSYEKININEIVRKTFAGFQEIIDRKHAEIKIEGDCEISAITVLFTDLINNLLDNSLKFSHPERQLKITIKSEIIKGGKTSSEMPYNIKYCHISYSDNGIGFDPRYNDRVFEFFERLNGQKYPGTGLGLSICRKIMEAHHGIIRANGEPDKGVRFDIYLPASPVYDY